jgi:hypothetical protein
VPSASRHPESAIQSLIALGVGRPEAIQLLDSVNGDPVRARVDAAVMSHIAGGRTWPRGV